MGCRPANTMLLHAGRWIPTGTVVTFFHQDFAASPTMPCADQRMPLPMFCEFLEKGKNIDSNKAIGPSKIPIRNQINALYPFDEEITTVTPAQIIQSARKIILTSKPPVK